MSIPSVLPQLRSQAWHLAIGRFQNQESAAARENCSRLRGQAANTAARCRPAIGNGGRAGGLFRRCHNRGAGEDRFRGEQKANRSLLNIVPDTASRASFIRLMVGLSVATSFGGAKALAGTVVLSPSDDTFINSVNPNNNNGGSASIFTGTDGVGGVMRGLVRFDLPGGLQGHATVTSVQLRLTLRALGDGTAGTGATETLQAVVQPWAQGNGVGNTNGTLTVGQACGGAIFGATWTQTDCSVGTSWTTAGAAVAAGVSGTASTVGVAVGALVTWDSAANPAMTADVQSWLDSPSANFGWRIASSTEGTAKAAQRFFSSESGTVPGLTIGFSCRAGFTDTGTPCVAAAAPVPAARTPAMILLAVLLALAGYAAFLPARDRSRR